MSPTGRIVDDRWLDAFHRLGAKKGAVYGAPPSRKLALLIRTALIAPPGKTLVWCDWSAIEARVLPWLADSRGAEKVLDIFRGNDADPSLPDIYEIEAAGAFGRDALEIKKARKAGDAEAEKQRQIGKVETLALGFGGGEGAFTAMATNYGVYIEPVRQRELIDGWRERNSWARMFWGVHNRNDSYGLWGAINSAIENPDTVFTAGRVAYVYDRNYLHGTVFCGLPGGRLLTYPSIRWETREVEDKKTGELVERTQLTFRKGYGRSALWYGKLAENVTQATAGSILRGTLTKMEYEANFRDWMPVVGHTHDEIVSEVDEANGADAKRTLHEIMVEGFDWSKGLPLAAEATSNWYYTKAKI